MPGAVIVKLTAEECELIAEGVMDHSIAGQESVDVELAKDFRALARVARMADGAE